MTSFKVGDKVRFIEDYMDYKKGDIVEVRGFWDGGIFYVGKGKSIGCYFSRVELVETKPTENQRITALENEVAELKLEVAELKLIIHELRDGRKTMRDVMNEVLSEPSTPTLEDIIGYEGQQYKKVDREAHEGDVVVFDKSVKFHGTEIVTKGKLYKAKKGILGELAFVDNEGDSANVYDGGITKFTPENVAVYELIKHKPLTPNQQRAAIIEKAKEFVKNILGEYDTFNTTVGRYKEQCVRPIFRVNEKKRAITVLIYGAFSKELRFKGITKCNPSDVFNEHIGKAIALGRALGLDVSEFEQAVQPNKVVSGMKIKSTIDWPGAYCGKIYKGDIFDVVSGEIRQPGKQCHVNSAISRNSEIIDDTNAIY